jgi:acetoin utilization protein AcuC
VAYVDVDVHHGDGVERIFYDDPRVLTISLHESGRYLFPGTGFADETGADASAVNVALPPGTRDAEWLRAFHAVVPPLLRAFAPDVLVTQHGCDSHVLDPLAHLALTIDGQRASYAALHDLAHELTDGKWIACGGGGYELVQVVPRVWTHLLAEATGDAIAPSTETPDEWRSFVSRRTGEVAPTRMTDDGATSYEPFDPQQAATESPVDAAIAETRMQVFPPHDLDPFAA